MQAKQDLTGYPSIDKPWLKYYNEEAVNTPLPECTIYECLWENNKDQLDDIAISYFDKPIKYRELFDNIEKAAKAFTALGITRGDIVVLTTVTTPETIYSIYALNRIGAISFMIDPRTSMEGIRTCMIETKAKVALTINIAYPKIEAAASNTSIEKIIVVSPADSLQPIKRIVYSASNYIKGVRKVAPKSSHLYLEWGAFLSTGDKSTYTDCSYTKDTCCVMVRTGGTTGIPKSVMLSNENLNIMALQYRWLGVAFNRKQNFLNIMPPFIAYGIVLGIHMPLCLGLTDVIIPQLDPNKFTDLIIKYKPAHLAGVPMHYEQLRTSRKAKKLDLGFSQMTGCGGDGMAEEFEKNINQFLDEHHCPYPITKGYGMTEISSAATTNKEKLNKLGSVGIPHLKTTVSVFDADSGVELSYGQDGEICMQAPTIMLGYYNNAVETNKVLRTHDDGSVWIHSGDIGHMDEDGFVFINGRLKRMIIRPDGHNVWPQQIENVLFQYPGVQDCAVVGLPNLDGTTGKIPTAFIVWDEQVSVEQKTFENIDAFCKKHLPERDCALACVSIDAIPHTPIGKVDYRALENL